jgi:hypothetical protein
MQENFEIAMNNEEGLWIIHQGEPKIVVSPVNNAGWRKVSVCIVGDNEAEVIGGGLLKEVEKYLVENHAMKQNNDLRNWRWKRNTIGHPSDNIVLHEANVRQVEVEA